MLWLHVRRAGNYLTKVEEVFGVHPRLGWELRLEKLDEPRPYTLGLVAFTILFWLGLLAPPFIQGLGHLMKFWHSSHARPGVASLKPVYRLWHHKQPTSVQAPLAYPGRHAIRRPEAIPAEAPNSPR